MKNYLASLYVLLAGILWGLIGIFVKALYDMGLSAMDIVAIRCFLSFMILFAGGLAFNRQGLKIKLKDSYLFIGTGILSMVFFNWCYFTAMNMLNISLAVILLYTAPAFVLVLSSIFLKEAFTRKKLLLIICTLIGCTFVAGFNKGISDDISVTGILIGLGSGLGYALYSIFGKLALRTYSSYTISLYTFLFAFVPLVPITKFWSKIPVDSSLSDIWLYVSGLALFSTVLAYMFYTAGLKKMESSKASMLATIEPVTAMVIGYFLFNENITNWQIAGSLIILMSVSLPNTDIKKLRFNSRGQKHF